MVPPEILAERVVVTGQEETLVPSQWMSRISEAATAGETVPDEVEVPDEDEVPEDDDPPEDADPPEELELPEDDEAREEEPEEDWASEEEGEDEEEEAAGVLEEAEGAGRPSSSSREMWPSSLKEDSQAGETKRTRPMNAAAAWEGRMRGIGMSGVPFGVSW